MHSFLFSVLFRRRLADKARLIRGRDNSREECRERTQRLKVHVAAIRFSFRANAVSSGGTRGPASRGKCERNR